MSIYDISAQCFIQNYLLNSTESLKEIKIDYAGKITVVKAQYSPIISSDRLLTPNEIRLVHTQSRKLELVTITKTFVANNDEKKQIEIYNAVEEIENIVSWIAFVTLGDSRIIKWSNIRLQPEIRPNGNTVINVGRKFNLPVDTPPIDESVDTLQVYNNSVPNIPVNYENNIKLKLPREIKAALRYYRKGDISFFPEEKIIFWVTSLEIISGLISEEAGIPNTCEKCNYVTIRRPAVNKKAIIDLLKSLNVSKGKTLDVIQKYRSKYAHGGVENFQYNDKTVNIVLRATYSLLILMFCDYFNKKEIIKYDDKQNHPLYGDLTLFKNNIHVLADSKLKA
ncbi:hypothetical protein P4571_15355 [Niallia alba]|uniref:hypothetical protein n=1 Tax=Niallia alba TaxID=2729105 RepID=UPI002E243B81|nr:hypothetical protein [Niallia alba]